MSFDALCHTPSWLFHFSPGSCCLESIRYLVALACPSHSHHHQGLAAVLGIPGTRPDLTHRLSGAGGGDLPVLSRKSHTTHTWSPVALVGHSLASVLGPACRAEHQQELSSGGIQYVNMGKGTLLFMPAECMRCEHMLAG